MNVHIKKIKITKENTDNKKNGKNVTELVKCAHDCK